MLNIPSLNFRSIVPVIAIGKYGELGFRDNYIGNTDTANRDMGFIGYSLLCQGFLKCQFNRCIAMWLWLLPKSGLATAFSTGFIKLAKATNFGKLRCQFLPRLVAIPRAILLRPLTCISGWLTTYRAEIRCAFTKAYQLLAFIRAIALRWFRTPTIERVKVLATIGTYLDDFHSHTYIIPQKQIEEKYCEIATKRCSQSVMRLQ